MFHAASALHALCTQPEYVYPASRQPNLGLLSLFVSLFVSMFDHSCSPFWLSQPTLACTGHTATMM